MDSWHSGPAWHVLPCFPNQVFNHHVRQPLAKPFSLYLITAWVPHTLSYNIGCWLGWKGGFRLSSQQLLRWLGLLTKTPLQSRSQAKFQYTFLPWWNLSWPGGIVTCSGYQIWYWLSNMVLVTKCCRDCGMLPVPSWSLGDPWVLGEHWGKWSSFPMEAKADCQQLAGAPSGSHFAPAFIPAGPQKVFNMVGKSWKF